MGTRSIGSEQQRPTLNKCLQLSSFFPLFAWAADITIISRTQPSPSNLLRTSISTTMTPFRSVPSRSIPLHPNDNGLTNEKKTKRTRPAPKISLQISFFWSFKGVWEGREREQD